jgi:hypothetical protein
MEAFEVFDHDPEERKPEALEPEERELVTA